MNFMKRIISILLAFVLVMSPISTAHATSIGQVAVNQGQDDGSGSVEETTNISEDGAGFGDGDAHLDGSFIIDESTPSDPAEETSSSTPTGETTPPDSTDVTNPGDGYVEDVTEPSTAPVGNEITIVFSYGAETQPGTWCNTLSDLSVVFTCESGLKSAKVLYTVEGNTEQWPKEFVAEKTSDSEYSLVIPANELKDGKCVFTAVAVDVDDVESSNVFELMLDVTGVNYSGVVPSGLSVIENVGYAKDSFTVNGFSDAHSGVKGITTVAEDGTRIEYSSSDDVVITRDISELVLEDNAGNVSSVSILTILNGCKGIVFDSDIPVISTEILETPVYNDGNIDYYVGSCTLKIAVSDDNINELLCYKNGSLLATLKGGDGLLETSYTFERSERYSIDIIVKDKSGNEASSNVHFAVDNEAPGKGTLQVQGIINDHNNTIYINSPISIVGTPYDKLSGYSRIEILNNGEVVGNELPFVINKSGDYSIVLYDNAGNSGGYSFSEIAQSVSNVVIMDSKVPEVFVGTTEDGIIGNWFINIPNVNLSVSDDNLKEASYTVYVDGKEVSIGNVESTANIDLSFYNGSNFKVVLVAFDYSVNSNVAECIFNVDNTPPQSVVVSTTAPSSIKGGIVYFNDTFEVNISAEDFGFGNIVYFLDDDSSLSGKFTNVSDGSHVIRVEDGLGNTIAVKSLGDYMGWGSNTVVIDSVMPVITAEKYNGAWVSKAPEYSFDISDNCGIDHVVVTINGEEMVNKSYSAVNVIKESIPVSLADATANSDGSYDIVVSVYDNSGLVSTWSDSVRVDVTAPVISNFEITGATNIIGSSIDGEDSYGFFFDGNGVVYVVVEDNGASSGIKSVWTRLEGYEWVENPLNSEGKAEVVIPKEFKGKLEAYAVDNVNNVSAVNSPDLLVSESAGTHDSSEKLVITLPNTEYTDINGLPLYNSDVTVEALVACTTSGINSVQWGIGGAYNVPSDINAIVYDKNLITEANSVFKVVENKNGMKVVVSATDMVGHITESSKLFSIDKDKPSIEVIYNVTSENDHYNVTRIATIKVTERNFNPDLFKIDGVYGDVGIWSNEGDVWSTTITFVNNNVYSFTLDCIDRAGNSAVQYVSESFVIDKTAPVISRVDDNKESLVGWYNYAPKLKFQVTENYLNEYSVYINEEKVLSGTSSEIILDTSKYTNMRVNVRVCVIDKAGNTDEYVYSYSHDNTAPTNISVTSDSPVVQKLDTVYFNNQFDIVVSADDGNGCGDLTYYLNDVASKNGKFTISHSGSYFIRVVDGLGHVSAVVSLGEYCGWNGNNVVINNTSPVVNWSVFNGSWLANTCIYDVNVKSIVGIDSIMVTVNSEEIINTSYDVLDALEKNIKVDISKATMSEDSSYFTVITVTDNSGIVTTVSDIVYVDLNTPEIGSLSADGKWEIHENKLYTKGAITINGTPIDVESGIQSVEVIKDGVAVGTLPYTISESGVYGVRVTDNVGNQTVFSFATIAGTSTSDIVWDDTFPSVYFNLNKSDKPQYIDGTTYWYAKNPTVYVDITDTNMKDVSVTVTIDGSEVVVVDDILEDGIYAIDTSYAQGRVFEVYATAKDKSGNVSEAYYKFNVDSVKPSQGTISVVATPEWNEVDGVVYIRGEFIISGAPSDMDSGIKDITVYTGYPDSTAIAATKYKGGIYVKADKENMSGIYTIEVTDNVGNIYKVKASELLGSTSNIFIVDLTDPVIKRTDSNVETKDGWYNFAPVFTYVIKDTYLSNYTVFVNGDVVLKGAESGDISVDTSKYVNQGVTIRIEVVDKAGNTEEYSYFYKHDNTPPVNVNIEMQNPVSYRGGNVYYNGPVDLVITSIDAAYGNISYYINGVRIENGKYTISKSGEYNFEVVDGLGNSTNVKTLADFFGWSGNNIVIDNEKPSVLVSSYNGKWIKGTGSYFITINDNIGIHTISAVVNGKQVVNITTSDIEDISESIEISTSMAALNSDGSFKTVVTVTDNSGLTTTWEDTVFVDNIKPAVKDFVVYGDVNRLNTSNGYGYFFNGNGTIEVDCSDGEPSSGIESIWTRLSGQNWVEHKASDAGNITVKIPAEFKGSLEAYVVDKVGNKSDVFSPAMLISETENSHNRHSSISLSLPETPYTDVSGLPLYSNDIVADLDIGCDWSGLQYIEWGTDILTKVSKFDNGVLDNNIVTKYSQNLPLTGNDNGIVMTVNMVDWSGNKSTSFLTFSIDKNSPVINVVYDSTAESGYYNKTRTATITVTDKNFDASKFSIGGNIGVLGAWKGSGDTWTNTITFLNDGDYKFTLDCSDRAGNKAIQYVSESFTIDKTAPIIDVTWSNNDFENGMYYNDSRVATVTVTEHNFDGSLFTVKGTGNLSAWNSNGDTHTATIRFDTDGEYEFSINGSDKAGNFIEDEYNSGKFVIDLLAPEIVFELVSDGVSYKNNVEFSVSVSDSYINSKTRVYLSGKLHDEIEVDGTFNGRVATFYYDNFPKNEDIDDIYTIRVVAVDNAGNEVEDSLTFSVNRFGSKYTFYNESMLGNYLLKPIDVVIYEVNVDKLDVSKVVISVTKDGKEIDIPSSFISITEEDVNGKFLYTYTISKELFLEDGKYTVSITSQSEDGTKYTSVSEQYDFVIDGSAPVVIISGVESDEDYREYSRSVAVDIRELSGISSVKIIVNGKEISDYTLENGVYSFLLKESGNAQSIVVEVVDNAGNRTISKVEGFLITSNLMVYLLNQFWFLSLIAFMLFLVVIMVILLITSRRKERDEEQEAIVASGELYRTTSGSSSSGSAGSSSGGNQILSGDTSSTSVNGESTTGFMEDNSGETGVME